MDFFLNEMEKLLPEGKVTKDCLIKVLKDVDSSLWSDEAIKLFMKTLPNTVNVDSLAILLYCSEVTFEQGEQHIENMTAQWRACLENPTKLVDTAPSKRSPFKFDVADSVGHIEMNLGVSAVALPDLDSDFGKRFGVAIHQVQDLWINYMPKGCKRQTTPHMSIGSVFLDKKTAAEYNSEILQRSGLIAKVKEQLDRINDNHWFNPPPRAKIETLKINPDGCVTFQLVHDPGQDIEMTEDELQHRLSRVPTCKGEAGAGESKKFRRHDSGACILTRFQQIRLALGELGCEIKGMYAAGHMVIINLIDPEEMAKLPSQKLKQLISRSYEAWSPLVGEWFDLRQIVCLCYIERSLNEGSVVLAPKPGTEPRAFPDKSMEAQSLLGGVFTANPAGDVLIDEKRFLRRTKDRARTEWQSLCGELWELVANKTGKTERDLMDAFMVFDLHCTGYISTSELGAVMEYFGEKLTEEQLYTMITCADIDNSGWVNYQEFETLMRSTTPKALNYALSGDFSRQGSPSSPGQLSPTSPIL